MTIERRYPTPPIVLLIIFLIVAIVLLLATQLAHAAISNGPTAAVTTGADAAWDMFRANGPWWGGFLVAFIALQTFLSHQHWLAQGRLLATLTGLAMVATAVANWRFGGAPSAGIVTAAVTAIALVWRPTVAAKPIGGPGPGPAAMLAVLLLGALTAPALTGCATGKAALAEGAVAYLRCEDVHIDAKLESDLKLYAESLPRKWLAGGVASLDAIKADLAPIKSDALRCLVAGALAAATALVSPPTPGAAISALASSTVAPAAVRAQFEIGARLAGWPLVRLAGGAEL